MLKFKRIGNLSFRLLKGPKTAIRDAFSVCEEFKKTPRLSYFFTIKLRTDRRSVGQTYGHVITKISGMGRLPHFLTHGASLQIVYPALIFSKNNCFPYMTINVLLLQYAEQTEPSSFINCMSTPYGTLVLRMGVFCIIF